LKEKIRFDWRASFVSFLLQSRTQLGDETPIANYRDKRAEWKKRFAAQKCLFLSTAGLNKKFLHQLQGWGRRPGSVSGPALLAPNRKSVDQTALLNVVLLNVVLLTVG
jgi:hypothetical protein